MRFTSAHALATAALFVALGGTSYAVSKLPKNSVGTEQVRDGSLRAGDLAPGVLSSGPRGPRGAEGPTGAQGATGPAGADVTQSQNPAIFRAHSVTPQTNSTAVSFELVLMGGEDFDPRDVYDPALSQFRAPVDGYYEFYATVLFAPVTYNRAMVQLVTDRAGQEIRGSDFVSGPGDVGQATDQQSHVSGVMKLKKGDRVWVGAYRTKIVTLPSSPLTSFGGYLVSAG